MAIGTLGAIGLGLAGVGSIIGGSSANKAAKTAAQTATDNTAQNNALAREIYGQNKEVLSPYVQRGNAAGNQMNALLGLGGAMETGGPATAQILPAYGGGAGTTGLEYRDGTMVRDPMYYYGQDMIMPGNVTGYGGGTFNADGTPVTTGTNGQPASAQQAANNAYEIYKNSTGYQSRLQEGANALNSLWAGAGTLQSGAAGKEFNRFGQNFASNEFGNYMGYLGNQQGVGLSGASALAGVGQNYANSVMTNNNNAATAQMNSALYRGSNNPFAGALGMIGGGLFGMS